LILFKERREYIFLSEENKRENIKIWENLGEFGEIVQFSFAGTMVLVNLHLLWF